MKTAFAALLCAATATGAVAQQEPDTDIFNGKWLVTMKDGTGKVRTARLQLVNFTGTWIYTSLPGNAATKACVGRKVPVTVQVSQAQTLEFTAWAQQVAGACADVSVSVHPVSEKQLQGTLATGEAVTLSRP